MFSSAFREVNFKSSSVLLPAALRLPLHRDVVSIITAKPLFFLLCMILVHFLPPVISEITQTSGEPRREQSMASATQRHSYMPESHCKGFAVPAKSLLGNTHVAQEGRRSPNPSAGAEAGVQELGPRGKQPRLFLSWRNIPPNPCARTEMSRTEMKGFNQLSLPPACVNQPWLGVLCMILCYFSATIDW